MKKIIFMVAMLFSSVSFAQSFMVGDWCGNDQLKTTEYRMNINEDGEFTLSASTELEPAYVVISAGIISQGGSAATMITADGRDLNLVEVSRRLRAGRADLLIFEHRNPVNGVDYSSTYAECRD